MQLLKRKVENSKVGEESKGRPKKIPAPANDVATDADLGEGSLAQKPKQKDEGKESPFKEERDDAVLDSDADLEMKSLVIQDLKKGKEAAGPEQLHLLHVGTPFEVFNFNIT